MSIKTTQPERGREGRDNTDEGGGQNCTAHSNGIKYNCRYCNRREGDCMDGNRICFCGLVQDCFSYSVKQWTGM